jgi:hypothetical protein
VLGSLIGFFGAAVGSVGGAGGGGIFVPMLALIIGFDPKSAAAMSKCEDLTRSCACILLIPSRQSASLLSEPLYSLIFRPRQFQLCTATSSLSIRCWTCHLLTTTSHCSSSPC